METDPLWEKLRIDDEINLIQRLFDVYLDEESNIGTIIHINSVKVEEYVRKNPKVCGFRNIDAINELASRKIITPIYSNNGQFPYFDESLETNVYKIIINWDELINYAGFLHDHEAVTPQGASKQRQIMKEILENIDKSSIKRKITVSEKILGSYWDHIIAAAGIRGDDSPDHCINFFGTIKDLEKQGFLKVLNIKFCLNVRPMPTEKYISEFSNVGLPIGEDIEFYPAEHCIITLELTNSQSNEANLLVEAEARAIPSKKLLDAFEEDAIDRSYQDEVQLISKLLQICSPQNSRVRFTYPASLSSNDPDAAGFDEKATAKNLINRGVFSNFNLQPDALKKGTNQTIEADVNFRNLLKRAEYIHDKIESWKGNVYGIQEQKKRILQSLQDYIKKSPHQDQEPYVYSERILGAYSPQNEALPLGSSFSNPDPNRPDIRYQFMRAMRELEKDGLINIVNVEFDFNALPKPTSESQKLKEQSFGERSLVFYPAKHCLVKFKLKMVNSISGIKIIPLPEDVDWILGEEKHTLLFQDKRKLEFINLKKPTAKYFKQLIENHGSEVKHKLVMGQIENITKVQVKNCIKALRRKIKNARLSDRIKFTTDYEGGYTLIITPKNESSPQTH